MRRFLKADFMEDGAFVASEAGCPQGGLVSPVLSNIYLHYVLDLWFEKRFAVSCTGNAHLIRYADDYVACFEQEVDARAFLGAMTERLAELDLEIEPTKTALVRFGSQRLGKSVTRPYGERTFSFLGLTHYVGRSRRGRFVLRCKTNAKRMQKKLELLSEHLRRLRSEGGNAMLAFFVRHLRGHIQYYGVSGNSRGLVAYIYSASGLLFNWLNWRSQRRSLTWKRFTAYIRPMLPRVRILHDLYHIPWWKTQTGSRMV